MAHGKVYGDEEESSPVRDLSEELSQLDIKVTPPNIDGKAASSAQSSKWKAANLPSADECKREDRWYISTSDKYPVSSDWITNRSIDLKKIVGDLPRFLKQVGQQSTAYKELKEVCRRSMSAYPKERNIASYSPEKGKSPYWSQCKDTARGELPCSKGKEFDGISESYEAYSLNPPSPEPKRNIVNIDCEYILDMHMPDVAQSGNNIPFDKRLTDPNTYETWDQTQRWIFIPSYLRAEVGLFNWKSTGIDAEHTNRIIVVIPSQFDTYIAHCGHVLPILCLPQDVLGIGYARHWILKIAMQIGLKYIWMIDDSVSWFCEYSYHADKMIESGKPHLDFESVLKKIEDIAQSDDCKNHLAAISPSRWRKAYCISQRFTYSPPQIAVYCNLKLIKEHQIQYRPELEKMEDMVFGAECVLRGGLTVCRWNEFIVYDMPWENTGASTSYFNWSPTPQDKTTTLSDSHTNSPTSRGQSKLLKPGKLKFGD